MLLCHIITITVITLSIAPLVNVSSDVTFPGMDNSSPFPQQGESAQLAASLLLRIATTPHISLGE